MTIPKTLYFCIVFLLIISALVFIFKLTPLFSKTYNSDFSLLSPEKNILFFFFLYKMHLKEKKTKP